MKSVRQEHQNVLLLDGGDAVVGAGDFADIKVDFYASAYSQMGYDAVGLGESEVRLIRENGRPSLYSNFVPLLCANVVDEAKGKTIATEPYIVKKVPSGIRVGVISVIDENLIDLASRTNLGIKIVPAVDALKKELPGLRGKSDIIVLISHSTAEYATKLVTSLPGIDVVLIGNPVGAPRETAEKVGDVLMLDARSMGASVATLALDIDADGKIASFHTTYAPMDEDIAEDEGILKFVTRHDEAIAELQQVPNRQTGPKPFVNAISCRPCHVNEYESWQKTQHVKAFESLKKGGRARDPECLACHTTGYRQTGGFISEAATPNMVGVQCESCHGPGVAHSRKPAKGYGLVSRTTCLKCHDPANSPEFDYNKYSEKVSHSRK